MINYEININYKEIAGKSFVAIPSTNAVVGGITVLEAIKMLQKNQRYDITSVKEKNNFFFFCLPPNFFIFKKKSKSIQLSY